MRIIASSFLSWVLSWKYWNKKRLFVVPHLWRDYIRETVLSKFSFELFLVRYPLISLISRLQQPLSFNLSIDNLSQPFGSVNSFSDFKWFWSLDETSDLQAAGISEVSNLKLCMTHGNAIQRHPPYLNCQNCAANNTLGQKLIRAWWTTRDDLVLAFTCSY